MKRSNKKMSGSNHRTNKNKNIDLVQNFVLQLINDSVRNGINTDKVLFCLFKNGMVIVLFFKNNKYLKNIIYHLSNNDEILVSFIKVMNSINLSCPFEVIIKELEKTFETPIIGSISIDEINS